MKAAKGHVFKYGDNVDTDVIIPARYLNSSDPKELALHCMEDIDKDFVKNVSAITKLTPAAFIEIGACSLDEPHPKFLFATMISPALTFFTYFLP